MLAIQFRWNYRMSTIRWNFGFTFNRRNTWNKSMNCTMKCSKFALWWFWSKIFTCKMIVFWKRHWFFYVIWYINPLSRVYYTQNKKLDKLKVTDPDQMDDQYFAALYGHLWRRVELFDVRMGESVRVSWVFTRFAIGIPSYLRLSVSIKTYIFSRFPSLITALETSSISVICEFCQRISGKHRERPCVAL